MASSIRIISYSAVQAQPHYCIRLSLTSDPFKSNIEIDTIIVGDDSANRVYLTAKLNPTIRLPFNGKLWLNSPSAFSEYTLMDLGKLNSEAMRQINEFSRRLNSQEIVWGDSPPLNFPLVPKSVTGDYRGDARLALDVTTGNWSAEFSFRSVVGSSVTYAFTLLVGGEAAIRIDLDHLNIGLPALRLPSFDLSKVTRFDFIDFSGERAGVARVLAKLFGGDNVSVQFSIKPGQSPGLYLDSGTGDWKISSAANEQPSSLHATVTIQNASGKQQFSFQDLKISGKSGTINITIGTITSNSLNVDDGRTLFGPFIIAWKDVKATPTYDNVNKTWLLGLSVGRLTLEAADDPDAMLVAAVDIDVTPSGSRLTKLQLLDLTSTPLDLLIEPAKLLESQTGGILRLSGLLSSTNALKPFLSAIGRVAVAAGRAITFPPVRIDGISKVIVGVCERVAAMIAALDSLEIGTDRAFMIEVRLTTDPLMLRQVMVWFKGKVSSTTDKFSVLGFQVQVETDWNAGILIDLVARPGAYFLVAPTATAKPIFATISSDLWLVKHDVIEPVRDVAPDGGGRGQQTAGDSPLMAATASFPANGIRPIIVIAGVAGGELKVLQKVSANPTSHTIRPGTGDFSWSSFDGAFDMVPLGDGEISVSTKFQSQRLLPLLGLGEPGVSAEPATKNDFLNRLRQSLSQAVWVKDSKPRASNKRNDVGAELLLGVKAAGLESEAKLTIDLDIDTLQVSMKLSEGKTPLRSRRMEQHALGLDWVVEQKDATKRAADSEVEMFVLAFETNGETTLTLGPEAQMQIRFSDLSSDGHGLVLNVTEFSISRAGLDLVAKPDSSPVVLNGIGTPFQFTLGTFIIKGGKLVQAAIGGRGSLPNDLVGEIDCSVLLSFQQDAASGAIILQSGAVEFDKRGQPIMCHATLFTLTLDALSIDFRYDRGYHFFFLLTGSIQFTPRPGEFEDGLLQFLKDVRIDIEKAPLCRDPTVLAKYVTFQKSLNPPKTFALFNLFEFEIRGFGFHGSSDRFGGDPAINISGQINFADIGDVKHPSIEFHGLWIAGPRPGETLQRVRLDGLGVNIVFGSSAIIRGSVLAVDPQTPTLDGNQFVPPGYDNVQGFLGEGTIDISGFASFSATLGFLEVARKDRPYERRKAFFFYLQKGKISVKIPLGIWTFYMREVGFGFGYRYTLAGIKSAENASSVAAMVAALDDISKRQGDLSQFRAWIADPEGEKVTLALRGAFQCLPPSDPYDQQAEQDALEPFFFDIVVALRSDFTFLMSTRGWLATSYYDFLSDMTGEKIRTRPGLRGYMYLSAPRSELLMRAIGDHSGYIGERYEGIEALREALRSIDWTATLYINPHVFHMELGWPDQLVALLRNDDNFRVVVRGGMIFRATGEGLLWGINISADANIRFSGSESAGSIGLYAEATLTAKFIARFIAYIARQFDDTLIYGLISLDVNISFNVRAWMHVDLGITSFDIRITFSFQLQLSAAVELSITASQVGARVQARVGVSIFGRTVSVGVGFTVNDGQLDAARARVERFLALGIGDDQSPNPPPRVAAQLGDKQLLNAADQADKAVNGRSNPPLPQTASPSGQTPPDMRNAKFGRDNVPTNFWLVLRATPDGSALGLLVPRESEVGIVQDSSPYLSGGFYSSPRTRPNSTLDQDLKSPYPILASHVLIVDKGSDHFVEVMRWKVDESKFDKFEGVPERPVEVIANYKNAIPARQSDGSPQDSKNPAFNLGFLFDECFLRDARWSFEGGQYKRDTYAWQEPSARVHDKAVAEQGANDAERLTTRDTHQKDQQALFSGTPEDSSAHEARSAVMAMFLNQFVAMADDPDAARDQSFAHVSDIGLVFKFAHPDAARAFTGLKVVKADNFSTKTDDLYVFKEGVLDPEKLGKVAGAVKLFNPREFWFDKIDPVLERGKDPVLQPDGVKLDWKLAIPFPEPPPSGTLLHEVLTPPSDLDNEHYLHHYEIRAEIQGRSRWGAPKLHKSAITLGGANVKADKPLNISTLRPAWQFTDDLADLPDGIRKALLPASDDVGTRAAYDAWKDAFGDVNQVLLTYLIVPVDVAGARGTERAFVVEAKRPTLNIRPAKAELRIIVHRDHLGEDVFTSTSPKTRISIILALQDGALDQSLQDNRLYRLISLSEAVTPTGTYGSDGLTEREAGLSAIGTPILPADRTELVFAHRELHSENLYDTASQLSTIEPDADAQTKFAYWILLVGDDQAVGKKALFDSNMDSLPNRKSARMFLEMLWKEGDTRVANSFYLVTEQDFGNPDNNPRSIPVHVPIELVVENLDKNEPPVLARPQEFEWPVRIDFPPHGVGEVRARSGFALFNAPDPDAKTTLESFVNNKYPVVNLRDPDRRILTTVEWDTSPYWPGVASALHASTIAGYDLFELDLDELAPLDIETETDVAFAQDAKMWRRAKHVARTQLLPQSLAAMTPHSNDDWQGWQAHYPSESWRVKNRGATDNSHQDPTRADWYSSAESTPRFPDRILRRRLLPFVDEQVIADILRGGRPVEIIIELVVTKTDAQWQNKDLTAPMLVETTIVDGIDLAKCFRQSQDKRTECLVVSIPDPNDASKSLPFGASDIRALQFCLAWEPNQDREEQWAKGEIVAKDLAVRLSPRYDNNEMRQHFDIGLDFSSPLHPALQETAALLTYAMSKDTQQTLYRRYNLIIQPAPKFDAADFAGFLAATTPGQDPYGWKALQMIGLAMTFRLYDADSAQFVAADKLLEMLSKAMSSVVNRYRLTLNSRGSDALGSPFAEVLLRPGRDRVHGPFYAVRDATDGRIHSDDLLAVVQISIRPTALTAWKYAVVAGYWKTGLSNYWTNEHEDQVFEAGVLWKFTRTVRQYDILRAADGAFTSVLAAPDTTEPILTPIRPPSKGINSSDKIPANREITMLIRYPAYDPPGTATYFNPATIGSYFTLHRITRKRSGTKENPVDIDSVDTTNSVDKFVGSIAPDSDGLKIILVNKPEAASTTDWGKIEAFGRFPTKSAASLQPNDGTDDWVTAFTTVGIDPKPNGKIIPGAAKIAFDALQNWIAGVSNATVPRLVDASKIKDVVADYLVWSQRFLDHGAAPDAGNISIALAAPIKAMPWRLAATQDGTVSISFLHTDRWAHSRAYAVRAYGRYRDLLVAAGAYRDSDGTLLKRTEVEKLITADLLQAPTSGILVKPIGTSVAISHRTEKMEPPLILSSSAWSKTDARWTLIVVDHSEEHLAASNRPLASRLGLPRSATTFVRDYQYLDWPERLAKAADASVTEHPKPDFGKKITPDPTAVAPGLEAENFVRDDISRLIDRDFPSLSKGASVSRFEHLPHHYPAMALYVSMAGAIVSPISTVAQTVFHVDTPSFKRFDQETFSVAIRRHEPYGSAFLDVTWPLIAHYDLMKDETRKDWVGSFKSQNGFDIALWPDPNVVYVLARCTKGDVSLREEDAEIRLVAEGVNEAEPTSIVVRTRGSRFKDANDMSLAVKDPGPGAVLRPRWTVMCRENGELKFSLTISLALKPPLNGATAKPNPSCPHARARVTFNSRPENPALAEFNTAAKNFAVATQVADVPTEVLLSVFDLPDDDAMEKLKNLSPPDAATLYKALLPLARSVIMGAAETFTLRAIHGRGGVSEDLVARLPNWL